MAAAWASSTRSYRRAAQGETPAHRKGASDVRRITLVFTTGVYKYQIAVLEGAVVVDVVQHTGVGAAADYGVVGRVGGRPWQIRGGFPPQLVFKQAGFTKRMARTWARAASRRRRPSRLVRRGF